MKPGPMTTEFWMALGTQVIALLVLFGYLGNAEQQAATTVWKDIVTHSFALIASGMTTWKYIHSRTELKSLTGEPS